MVQKCSAVALLALTSLLVTAGPALAQEVADEGKPWHYWIAPLLLAGAVLAIVGLGLSYWSRVVGGRTRR